MIRAIQGFLDWAGIFFNGLTEIDPFYLGLWALTLVLLLGSACASATIAEMRHHKILLHFLGGLFLPWVYPALIGMRLTPCREAAKEKQEERETEIRLGVKMTFLRLQFETENKLRKKKGEPELAFRDWIAQYEAAKQAEAQEQERKAREIVAPTNEVNRLLLENLAVDSDGSRKGPFIIKLADGRKLQVEQIKNVMDDVAAFEIIDPVTHKPKNIRVKYANITYFRTLEQ